MTNRKKLTTERKKDPAYISTGFTSWKKAPECFKEHKQRKCHTATLIYETYAPKMCNLVEMHITEIAEKEKDCTRMSVLKNQTAISSVLETIRIINWRK